jgi:hypothetical protein
VKSDNLTEIKSKIDSLIEKLFQDHSRQTGFIPGTIIEENENILLQIFAPLKPDSNLTP